MKDHSIQYLQDDNILQITLLGDFDASRLSRTTTLLAEELVFHNCNRILMDHRKANPMLSSKELSDRPNTASILGIPKTSKIAIVYSASKAAYQFIENVGQKHGYSIKIFIDINKAINWLKE